METMRKAGPGLRGLSRRELLGRAVAAGALAVVGPGFMAAPDAAWAVEVRVIGAGEMATLVQVARDIYPHDRVADRRGAATTLRTCMSRMAASSRAGQPRTRR